MLIFIGFEHCLIDWLMPNLLLTLLNMSIPRQRWQDCVPPVTAIIAPIKQQRRNCKDFWVWWVIIEVTELLKAKARFICSSECEQAFWQCEVFVVLPSYFSSSMFWSSIDTPGGCQSHWCRGSLEEEEDDQGVVRLVHFFPRKFNCYRVNYSAIE